MDLVREAGSYATTAHAKVAYHSALEHFGLLALSTQDPSEASEEATTKHKLDDSDETEGRPDAKKAQLEGKE